MIVLAPLLSYSVKIWIEYAIGNVKQDIWTDLKAVDNLKQDIWQDLSVMKKGIASDVKATQLRLEEQLIFLRVLSQANALTNKTGLIDEDIDVLFKDLSAIAAIERYQHRHELSMIVKDIAFALIHHGKVQLIGELEALFPQVIKNSNTINMIFLAHYALELIKTVDTTHIETLQTRNYRQFHQHLTIAKKQKLYTFAIPYELLVLYHLHRHKKNPAVDSVLKTVSNLNTQGKATILWQLFQMTNPHFWETNAAIEDHRIADAALSFLQKYADRISAFSLTEPDVKTQLINKFHHARSLREEHLGKYILNYLYDIHDEKSLTESFTGSLSSPSEY